MNRTSNHLSARVLPGGLLLALVLLVSAACAPEGEDGATGAVETGGATGAATGSSSGATAGGAEGGDPAEDGGPAPLESVRNFQVVDDRLASSGQIAYDQVPEIRDRGYEVVINLAVADEDRNALEGFHVTREGLSYVHIPVDWEQPRTSDVRMFFDVMEANKDRKVYVHCFANMRASAFVYLYRTLVEGVAEEEARATMNAVWDPADQPQWEALIEEARREYDGGR
jgi:protein tyrosine phosphatase (PTP) superfamily phosphohydrolase (DUF442 family)